MIEPSHLDLQCLPFSLFNILHFISKVFQNFADLCNFVICFFGALLVNSEMGLHSATIMGDLEIEGV